MSKATPGYKKKKRIAAQKRTTARRMLKAGKSNAQIAVLFKARYGSGIGPDALAAIREDLNISGSNRGVKNVKNRKQNGVNSSSLIAKRASSSSSPVPIVERLKANGGSPELESGLQTTFKAMRLDGITALAIREDGFVQWQQTHEMLLDGAA